MTPKKQTKVVKCAQKPLFKVNSEFFRLQQSTNNLGSQAAETLTTTWAVSGVCSCSVFTVCPVDRSVNSDTGALARWTNTCYLWMNDLNNKLLITRRPLHFNILSGNVSCTDILASLPNIWSMKTISRSKDFIYGAAFNRSTFIILNFKK